MKKDYYMYPAIFCYDKDGISISFPDLAGCISCASTDEEALYMAKDALGLYLVCAEEDGDVLPVASKLTIPKWLNDFAEKNKVNFSQVLQHALKEYLQLNK